MREVFREATSSRGHWFRKLPERFLFRHERPNRPALWEAPRIPEPRGS